jgi:hypothetical protein
MKKNPLTPTKLRLTQGKEEKPCIKKGPLEKCTKKNKRAPLVVGPASLGEEERRGKKN